MSKRRYLFYISQNYSFEILRPLQSEIIRQGSEVHWFVAGNKINFDFFNDDEKILTNVSAVIEYNPDACFVPGNVIPSFIPGIKVQVFHGLEWKKKGHFVIRDCFDLYCTHGEVTTSRFNKLAQKHKSFDVVETGWPKLDTLFNASVIKHFENSNPTILYAPTFSPSLTSAPILYEKIKSLSEKSHYNWLIKFHPKMADKYIADYSGISSENLKIIDTDNINVLLQSANMLISDTSSVIGEFSLLSKPVITLNNSAPGEYLIDIQSADQLDDAIKLALNPTSQLKNSIQAYAEELHPYTDGRSSARILQAVESILINGKKAPKKLPLNIIRNFKQRKKLNYWRF
ncbi:CDP-glycerol glycerophosphotransferase family protein [Thalassotalea sediminis]|uniref:CDP-glycerol glycerophosphotransferase family protein n=1 Tax=Thalassotalea sediminis TaxID=1759089 RepID=UPI002572E7FE|nr:CDP-glycerol glycerophosphotransferase family protein [Thalassotalea sediminis]